MATAIITRKVRDTSVYMVGSDSAGYSWTAERTQAHKFDRNNALRIAREYNGTAYARDGQASVIDAAGNVAEVREPATSYVVAHGADGSSHVGASAVQRFQLLAIRSALKLEMIGLRHSRGSVLKVAKSITGLRTNDRAQHMARIAEMVRELETQIEFRATGETP